MADETTGETTGSAEDGKQQSPKRKRATGRIILTVVGVCLLCICGYFYYTGKTGEQEHKFDSANGARMLEMEQHRQKVVYAIKEIPDGSKFTRSSLEESLEEREIPAYKVPLDAVASASDLIGRVAKYEIPPGQIISEHDLVSKGKPVPENKVPSPPAKHH